ncbi:crossover junction endodeoxyribonuclease RuvC [Desulfogranum mediterraneum]|uniref:crossover junction endodeoxyribonuclease RuvC n=1 Tax=Desulfogranum mediterraneum TaxID=160661 RepID=UPI000414B13E|nr:crossover junction endodeoxyribonuclease RuvC [Desulfogranum mediterraneum]
MIRILGIDPGSRVTGYGVIAARGHELGFIACGTIRTTHEADFSRRLAIIFEGISQVVASHQPQVAAVEEIFVSRNPGSALKLGHARGAAIVAVQQYPLQVFDYTARKVKQTISGYGQADKAQVQQMVQALLELDVTPSSDAADALAVAICHAQHLSYQQSFSR